VNSHRLRIQVIVYAVGGFFLFAGAYRLYQDHRFATEPVKHTTGSVYALYQYQTSRGNIYSFDYHYIVGNSVIGVLQPTNPTTWNSLHVGDSLHLTYLENSPSVSRIDWPVEIASQTSIALSLVIIGALIIGLFHLLLFFYKLYQRNRRGKIITPLFD
jgi:hypothetical protein